MTVDMDTQDHQDPYLVRPRIGTCRSPALAAGAAASACTARFSVAIMRGATVLASGKVGVYGEYAVFDQIETHPEHRRHGYGRLIMQTLAARALEYPVTHRAVAGQHRRAALYFKMGWRSVWRRDGAVRGPLGARPV